MGRLTDVFGSERPVALVTGSGAPRVGNTIVRTLAARGYRCAVHANRHLEHAEATVAELLEQSGVGFQPALNERQAGSPSYVALQADLTSEAELHGLIDKTFAHFGRVDVLVNAAAIWETKRLEDVTLDDVRRHFEINTLATFEAARYAGLKMVAQETGGTIVNLGDWAIERPYLHYAAYFPSKGAIPALTRTLAAELAWRNPRVRVNAVQPGPVMLPPDLPADQRQAAIAATLVKREGTPQHVADAVVFLIENDFVTGECLTVDGGRTIYSET
jgi:pteridine reductase